ncbi:MAG: DUF4167 domain-containing protein [Pseudomonadota bacterium]
MKRGRNQRRRQGMNPNRALDSNGPDVRIRGTANQIYDKYLALARDATSSGDRVKAENYLQHAEHYFRLIRAMQPDQRPASQESQNNGTEQEAETTAANGSGDQPAVNGKRERRPTKDEPKEEAEVTSSGQSDAGDNAQAPSAETTTSSNDSASASNGHDGESAADKDDAAPRKPRRKRRPRKPAEEDTAAAPVSDEVSA